MQFFKKSEIRYKVYCLGRSGKAELPEYYGEDFAGFDTIEHIAKDLKNHRVTLDTDVAYLKRNVQES